jgi:uncharacterized protein with HEPN domain
MLRDNEYLLDILEAAKLVLSYVSGKTREEFFEGHPVSGRGDSPAGDNR